MRIAVGLPSLHPLAPERGAIDGMLAHLAADGHQVEGFAEHDRSDEAAAFPVFHYLRMPERHAARRFDAALWPLGRDATPYQGTYALMQRFPGAVWLLDPIVHHLAVGGIALMEDWAAYRELLDDAYGPAGAAIAQTVASNWGTGALFRRYDLLRAVTAPQTALLAAWPSLAARLAGRVEGRDVAVVPLGLEVAAADAAAEAAAVAPGADGLEVVIMTVNEAYATTAVRVADAALECGARVRVCLSEPIYKAEARGVARHRGIEERIGWRLGTSAPDLAAAARGADVMIWLAEELQGGHRLRMLRAMAVGTPTVVPRCALYDDLPEGAVAKLDLGSGAAAEFAGILHALIDDQDLRAGLAEHGAAFARACPDCREAANTLAAALQAVASSGVDDRRTSARTWDSVDIAMSEAALPGGAEAAAAGLVTEMLRSHTRPFRK